MDTIRKFFILTDDKLFWRLRSLVWACVAGLEKRWEQSRTSSLRPLLRMLADRWSSGTKTLSMRVRWEKKPVALSLFPLPPLPYFAPATQGQKSPLDGFLTGTTEVLTITYRGGYMLVTCDVLLAKKPGTKPQMIPNFKGGFRSGPRGRGAEATLFLWNFVLLL